MNLLDRIKIVLRLKSEHDLEEEYIKKARKTVLQKDHSLKAYLNQIERRKITMDVLDELTENLSREEIEKIFEHVQNQTTEKRLKRLGKRICNNPLLLTICIFSLLISIILISIIFKIDYLGGFFVMMIFFGPLFIGVFFIIYMIITELPKKY